MMKISRSPFDLQNDSAYQQWRQKKLTDYPVEVDGLSVAVDGKPDAFGKIIQLCQKTNMALYRADPDLDAGGVKKIAARVGLKKFDLPLYTGNAHVTKLAVTSGGRQGDYIPYTNKPLSWHTDGYYNMPDQQIRGMVLHCRRPAKSGGVSRFMDPEIAYIRMRDENPEWVRALMQNDVLTIPENREGGALIRGDSRGPVFSVIKDRLHMRYSARKKFVIWKDDPDVTAARQFLTHLLGSKDKYIFTHRLRSGEGLISNNVLHNRSGFEDHREAEKGRLFYRARFYDGVTKLTETPLKA